MTIPKKKIPPVKKTVQPDSHWTRVAKEIGAAAAMAALPILLNYIAEALVKAQEAARQPPDGGVRKTNAS